MKYELVVTIDTDSECQDLHITDSKGNSVSYGDSNFGEGMTVYSVLSSVKEHLEMLEVDIE